MKGKKDVGFGRYCMRFREEKYILSKKKKKRWEHMDLELGKKVKKKKNKKEVSHCIIPFFKIISENGVLLSSLLGAKVPSQSID